MRVSDCARVAVIPQIDLCDVDDNHRRCRFHRRDCLRKAVDVRHLALHAVRFEGFHGLQARPGARNLQEKVLPRESACGHALCEPLRSAHQRVCRCTIASDSGTVRSVRA